MPEATNTIEIQRSPAGRVRVPRPTAPTIRDGGPACTRVTFTLRCSPSGLAKLMAPMVAKTMRSEVAPLERLRTVLES